jgi:hypothetical protein
MRYIWNHLHWRNLRKIASSKVVQSTALFPFIGYFALINDSTKSFLEQDRLTHGLSWLNAEDRLFLIYFGLFLIGAGILIYNLRCPFLTKYFENENACAQFYMQMASLGQVYAMLISVFGLPGKSPNPIHRAIETRYDEFDRDPAQWQQFLSTHREEIFGFYVHWYSSEGDLRPLSRAICAVFLALGFLFLSLPSMDTFFAVSRALL